MATMRARKQNQTVGIAQVAAAAAAAVEVVGMPSSSGPLATMRTISMSNRIPTKSYRPAKPSSVKIPVPAGTDSAGEAPFLVRSSPKISHGCRPASAVTQPAMFAM
jgi:hypothetical protein